MQRNVNNLIGNVMQGTDGEMGKVEDFYFDDQVWIIVYLIVKTGNWFSDREVLISPYSLIKGMYRSGSFPVNLTREQIKNSPDIDIDLPVSRHQAKQPIGDAHLRSTHALTGYQIETSDGQLGQLRDFIIDDETWHIEYLVVELKSWLIGKRVLIPRMHIKQIQWSTSKILVHVTSNVLENTKAFDESQFLHPQEGVLSEAQPIG